MNISNLRNRLQSGIDSKWMGGIAIICYGEEHGERNGDLDAIPGAYLSDASYTENPTVVTQVDAEDAEELLGMDDAELVSYLESL